MTAHDFPLTETPADENRMAVEYIRIGRAGDTGGYLVTRCRPHRGGNTHETLATLCGGNLGKVLALTVAQQAARTGLIDTIYLDGNV